MEAKLEGLKYRANCKFRELLQHKEFIDTLGQRMLERIGQLQEHEDAAQVDSLIRKVGTILDFIKIGIQQKGEPTLYYQTRLALCEGYLTDIKKWKTTYNEAHCGESTDTKGVASLEQLVAELHFYANPNSLLDEIRRHPDKHSLLQVLSVMQQSDLGKNPQELKVMLHVLMGCFFNLSQECENLKREVFQLRSVQLNPAHSGDAMFSSRTRSDASELNDIPPPAP